MPETSSPLPPFDGVCRLAEWGVIRASGVDARSFLQSQLTQDMATASTTRARLAGYCSPKGRLVATFVVWQVAADEYLLACSADLLSATLKRLSMFVLRAKCTLGDASAAVPLFGIAGASAQRWLERAGVETVWGCAEAQGSWLLRLPDAQGHARVLLAAATPPEMPALDATAWAWLEVQSAVPRITAATAERFVPQMVNLELLDGVSFSKGCYPGQEVVARSQYRGTLKRRSYLVDSSVALAAASEIFHSADAVQPAGLVVMAASLPGERHSALAELKIAATLDGTLHAGSPGGARLRLAPLPYELTATID